MGGSVVKCEQEAHARLIQIQAHDDGCAEEKDQCGLRRKDDRFGLCREDRCGA